PERLIMGEYSQKHSYLFGALTLAGCSSCAFQSSRLRVTASPDRSEAADSVIFFASCPRSHESLQAELKESARYRPGLSTAVGCAIRSWESPSVCTFAMPA